VAAIVHLFDFLRARPIDEEQRATEEARRNEVIEKLARAVVARRLEAPATLFLELNRPLGFIYSQAAFFARPFLSFFLRPEDVQGAAEVLADPGAFNRLVERIAELSGKEEG
jgi:hypothetical protein